MQPRNAVDGKYFAFDGAMMITSNGPTDGWYFGDLEQFNLLLATEL